MTDFSKKVVDLSRESVLQGKFPAGALLVKDNEVAIADTSSVYPNIHLHAETRIIDKMIAETNDQLGDYVLYTSLAPCLMCMGKIYWSGINKVYYVLSRTDVDVGFSYEGTHILEEMVVKLNRKIEFIQDKTHFKEALEIYKKWQSSQPK